MGDDSKTRVVSCVSKDRINRVLGFDALRMARSGPMEDTRATDCNCGRRVDGRLRSGTDQVSRSALGPK